MSEEPKPTGLVIGGVDQIDGAWHAIFEIHQPCDGAVERGWDGQHRHCKVVQRLVSPAVETELDAVALVLESRERLSPSPGAVLIGDWKGTAQS